MWRLLWFNLRSRWFDWRHRPTDLYISPRGAATVPVVFGVLVFSVVFWSVVLLVAAWLER